MLDIEMVKQFYAAYSSKISTVRETLKRPLTYAEKILFTHLYEFNKMLRPKWRCCSL